MKRSVIPALAVASLVVILISILGGILGGQTDTVGSRNLLGSDRVRYTNAGVTGTTLNKLAKLTGAPSTAVITATTDTSGIIGIVVAGAGTTGSADIAYKGKALCVFDSATTAGHYIINDTSTAGDCEDGGATYPTSGQVIGVVTTTNGGAGTYEVDLTLGQPQAGGASSSGGVQRGTFAALPACNAGNTNVAYMVTDGPFIMQCNGTTWSTFWRGYAVGTMAVTTDFSDFSSGAATTSNATGGIDITGANNSAIILGRNITAPARPFRVWACFEYEAGFDVVGTNVGQAMSIAIARPADAKSITFGYFFPHDPFQLSSFSGNGTYVFSGWTFQHQNAVGPYAILQPAKCLGFHETSTRRYYEKSEDGRTWNPEYDEAVATTITNPPTQFAIKCEGSANLPPACRVTIWGMNAL